MSIFDEYCLSFFDLCFYNQPNGHVNRLLIGVGTSYFGTLVSGKAHFCSRDADFWISAGETVYIPRGCVYTSSWYGEPYAQLYSLPFLFRTEGENDTRFSLQRVECDGIAEKMRQIYAARSSAPLRALSLFYALYADVLPFLKPEKKKPLTSSVQAAIRYMEQHPDALYGVPDLAALCGMSESNFYALFKKQTEMTPVAYKNKLRCIRAVEMLRNTDYTVEYISEKLNFSSPMYLRKILRQYTGKTPRMLRRDPMNMP